jgi:hypothetical protein
MSALQIIRHGRTSARSAQAAKLLLVACLAAASGGCQWILDDLDDATSDGAEDGSQEREEGPLEDGALPSVEDGGTVETAPGGRDAAAHDGAMASKDAAPGAGTDASAGGADASANGGGRDADTRDVGTPLDGAEPAADVAVSCSEPVWWYEDEDQDGYGRSSAMVRACPAPSGNWAPSPGDCNDDHPRVHPGQSNFFGDPYQAPDGSESFDYDCSGEEEGNGTQEAFSGSCGLIDNLVCVGGSGYVATARPGARNALCGSGDKATCVGGLLGTLVCQPKTEPVAEPYWCR